MEVIRSSFIATAYANASGATPAFDPMQFLPLVVIFAVFYFLFLRPQQKRQKQKTEMIKALRRGDKVVTAGGLIGAVDRLVNDQEVMIELASGVVVRVIKDTIVDVLAKPEPVVQASSAPQSNVVTMAKSSAIKTGKSASSAKKVPTKNSKPKK